MSNIIPVNFHNDTLALIEHNGQPFVAMKPIVENMGLAWQRQHAKLSEKFSSTITIMVMVAEDGKSREMACLPLRKIPAFLSSINPNKVRPELKDKIIQYQNECDEVLWQYWTKGYVGKAGQKPPTYNQQITHMSQIMGIDPPEMENIKPVVKPVSSWEEKQVMDGLSEPKNPHPLPPELWGMDMDGRNED